MTAGKNDRHKMTAFASNLNRVLSEREIPLSVLSKATGIPKTTLHQWTSGTMPQDMESVLKLAEYLDLDFQYLLTGKAPVSRNHTDPLQFFDVEDEPSMSGLFLVQMKRVKPKKV